MKNTAKILELAFSTLILAISLYALYTGPGIQLVELAKGRIRLDIRTLAIIGALLGSQLLLDTMTGLLSKLYRSRPAYKEILVTAIPFYLIGFSLELLVIVRVDLTTLKFALFYFTGLISLETAFWLTAQSLMYRPFSVEIRRRGLDKVPWYHRLSYLRIRGIAPVLFLSEKLTPLTRRVYRLVDEALLSYTEKELGLLLGSLTFLLTLLSIGLIISLYPWIGYSSLLAATLPIAGLVGVLALFYIKREDRKESGKENALWLALAGRLSSRLGLLLHTVFNIAGFNKESLIANRYLYSGRDPLAVMEKHPCRKIRMIITDYKDIIAAGGDPEPVLQDYQARLLEEHEQRMRRMAEEALVLLEASLILLGLGPLIAMLAGSLQGNNQLLKLYTSIILPLGIVAAGIFASRLPADKASIPKSDIPWLIAGISIGATISLLLKDNLGIALTLPIISGLLAYFLKHEPVLDSARAEKEEAPHLLRQLAEAARSGTPLISLLEQRASTARHYRIKQLYWELLDNLRSRGSIEASAIHEIMKRTLKLAGLLYEMGATAHDIEQVKRYIEAILAAEKEARGRLRVLIALLPFLPFLLLYTLNLVISHFPSVLPVSYQISWELIELAVSLSSIGIGLIAGRIYYGRWDNLRIAILVGGSLLLSLFFI